MFNWLGVLLALAVTVTFYRQARLRGEWSWRRLFAILAAFALFTAAYIVPLANDRPLYAHPVLLAGLLIGGNLVFVGLLCWYCLRHPLRRGGPPPPPAAPPAGGSGLQRDS